MTVMAYKQLSVFVSRSISVAGVVNAVWSVSGDCVYKGRHPAIMMTCCSRRIVLFICCFRCLGEFTSTFLSAVQNIFNYLSYSLLHSLFFIEMNDHMIGSRKDGFSLAIFLSRIARSDQRGYRSILLHITTVTLYLQPTSLLRTLILW